MPPRSKIKLTSKKGDNCNNCKQPLKYQGNRHMYRVNDKENLCVVCGTHLFTTEALTQKSWRTHNYHSYELVPDSDGAAAGVKVQKSTSDSDHDNLLVTIHEEDGGCIGVWHPSEQSLDFYLSEDKSAYCKRPTAPD